MYDRINIMRTFSRVVTSAILTSFLFAQLAPSAAFAQAPLAPPAPAVGLSDIQQLTRQNPKLATALANGIAAELGVVFGNIFPNVASGLERAALHMSGLSRELNTAFHEGTTRQAKTILGAGLGQAVSNFDSLNFHDGLTPGTPAPKPAPQPKKPALQSAELILVAHAEEPRDDASEQMTIEVPIDIGTTVRIPVPLGLPSRTLDYFRELELRMNKKMGAAVISRTPGTGDAAGQALARKLAATYALWQLIAKTKGDLLTCPYDPKGTSRALKQWVVDNFVTPELVRFRSRLETDLDILNERWVRDAHMGLTGEGFRKEQSYHEDQKDSAGNVKGDAYRHKAGRLVEGRQIVGNDIDRAVQGEGQLFTYIELNALYMLEDAMEDFVNNCTTNPTNIYNDVVAKTIKHLLQTQLLGDDEDKAKLIVEQINKELPKHIDTNISALLAALDGSLENLRSILGAAEAFHTKQGFQNDLAALGKALDEVVALTPGDCCAAKENPALTLAKTKAGAEIKACHEPGTTVANVEGILKELLLNLLKEQVLKIASDSDSKLQASITDFIMKIVNGDISEYDDFSAKVHEVVGKYYLAKYDLARSQQSTSYKLLDPIDSEIKAVKKAIARLTPLLLLTDIARYIQRDGCTFDPATGRYKHSFAELLEKALSDFPELASRATPLFVTEEKLKSAFEEAVHDLGTADEPGLKVVLDKYRAIAAAIDSALRALHALTDNNGGQLQAMQSAILRINELVNKMSSVGAELQNQVNRSGRTGSAAARETRAKLEDEKKNGRFKEDRALAAKKLNEMDQDAQRKQADEAAIALAADIEKRIVQEAAAEESDKAQKDVQAAQCQDAFRRAAALTAAHSAQEQQEQEAKEAARLQRINQLKAAMERLEQSIRALQTGVAGKMEDPVFAEKLNARIKKLTQQIVNYQQELNGLLNKK